MRCQQKTDMEYRTFILLLSLALVASECSLENLYKDSKRQNLIRKHLSTQFELRFSEVLLEARDQAKYLVPPAVHFKKDLKKFYVEFGLELESYVDLDIALKGLKYIDIPLFKAYREDVETFGKNGSHTIH